MGRRNFLYLVLAQAKKFCIPPCGRIGGKCLLISRLSLSGIHPQSIDGKGDLYIALRCKIKNPAARSKRELKYARLKKNSKYAEEANATCGTGSAPLEILQLPVSVVRKVFLALSIGIEPKRIHFRRYPAECLNQRIVRSVRYVEESDA